MRGFVCFFVGVLYFQASNCIAQATDSKAPSATSELEHNIYIGYGYNLQSLSLNAVTFPFLEADAWVKTLQARPLPQLEITFSKWFENRNYVGATFRTGKVGYDITLADNPAYPFHNPEVSQFPEERFNEWHLYYFGVFWQLEITPEVFLSSNKKNNWIYQLSLLTELGVNLMTESWDQTYALNHRDNVFAEMRLEYVRNSQIRGGLRLRNALIKGRYSLAIDLGWNGGYGEFHFQDIKQVGASPSATPFVEIRNQNHYFFINTAIGYWF
ncbi:MAG: hypothetical protein LAT76_09865 [Schleiferiaceae bacterium]|nr:hypothetical protein [Schleiferiaceae bacterium]